LYIILFNWLCLGLSWPKTNVEGWFVSARALLIIGRLLFLKCPIEFSFGSFAEDNTTDAIIIANLIFNFV
jgi:hypothetical protein